MGRLHRQAPRVRVAYYSPLPPERSGIADYSAHLLPALRERIDVEFVRRGRTRPARGTDLSLYHVGNNPDAHGWIVEALRKRPGVVVLHDFVLHHLVAGLTIGRRDGHGYLDAMEREAGVVGRLLAHGVLDKRIPPLWESRPEDFHLAGEVLGLATGLIVHSRYVEARVRAAGYEGMVWRIPHPAWEHAAVAPAAVTGTPVIGSFGNVNASKRIPQLLEAFARLRRDRAEARLLLVGAVSPGFDLERRLQRLGLTDAGITREAFVEEERLWALMAACDVCVSLRSPTMGETSGSVIRQLSLGKPVVVSDVGWFAELPGDVALKVPVDAEETETLHAALELLARDERTRTEMSAAALELVRREHDLGRAAELYFAALEQAAGGDAVADAVLGDVSRAASEVGIEAGSPEAAELARRLAELELGR
jgi:glycosyltransferase involved in cell wall biosynthesis